NVPLEHLEALDDPERGEVESDDAGGPAILLDERRVLGAAGERLDPERSRAREEVGHAQVLDVAEDREERLPDAVGRRAGANARRDLQPPTSVLTRDDPHATALRGYRLALRAEAARELVAHQGVFVCVERRAGPQHALGRP